MQGRGIPSRRGGRQQHGPGRIGSKHGHRHAPSSQQRDNAGRPFNAGNTGYYRPYDLDNRTAFARHMEEFGFPPASTFARPVPPTSSAMGLRHAGSGHASADHRGLMMLLAAAEQVLGPLVAEANHANERSNNYTRGVGNPGSRGTRQVIHDHGSYMSYAPYGGNRQGHLSQGYHPLRAYQDSKAGGTGREGSLAVHTTADSHHDGVYHAPYSNNSNIRPSHGYDPVQFERPPNVGGSQTQESSSAILPPIADLLQTVQRMHVDDERAKGHTTTNRMGAMSDGSNNWEQQTTSRTPRLERQSQFANIVDRAQSGMASSSPTRYLIAKRNKTSHDYHDEAAFANASSMKPFNIFEEFLKRPELTFILAKHLRVQELLTLYSISKDFHNIINIRLSTTLFSQALTRAPDSATIFPFRCYAKLCQRDPYQRPHPVSAKALHGEARTVPTFRWLFMVCFREMVCHEIVTIMAEDGIPVPDECEVALKKTWFMMDIPDNHRRIGLVQNPDIFTDVDLFFATMFFVKLDMRFNDPVTGNGKDGMRRLLLSQPSLSMLWRALKRTAFISKIEIVKAFIRWKHNVPEHDRGMSMLGVPPEEIGIMQYENWGRTGSRIPLQRPDELILKEGIRRRLRMQEKYTDMFLWGYVDPRTMEDVEPRKRSRRLKRLEGLEDVLVPKEDKERVVPKKMISTRVVLVDDE